MARYCDCVDVRCHLRNIGLTVFSALLGFFASHQKKPPSSDSSFPSKFNLYQKQVLLLFLHNIMWPMLRLDINLTDIIADDSQAE